MEKVWDSGAGKGRRKVVGEWERRGDSKDEERKKGVVEE